MTFARLLLAATVAAVIGAAPAARADLVTYQFSGQRVSNGDPAGEFPVGDSYTGSVTLDTSVAGSPAADSTIDFYYSAVTSWSVTFATSGAVFAGTVGSVGVGNDTSFGSDRLIITLGGAPVAPLASGRSLNFFQLDFFDNNADFLSSSAIPTSFDLALVSNFGGRLFLTSSSTSDQLLLQTTAITSVPAPAPLALFGLGLAGLGFVRRRRAG